LDTVATESEIEGVLEFQIEAGKGREAAAFVPGPDVVTVLVEFGIGETGVDIEDGDELEFVGETDDAPKKDAIRSVARKRAVLVSTDKRVRIVAEELVVVVELTESARADITGDEAGAFGGIPAEHGKEFFVGLRAGVE
jgi:hypothetical protein